jgi:exodeoxyribonuclease VIII
MFWQMMDINCKARPDYIRQDKGLILDLKTCLDARSDPFSRSCWNYRYHVQAAYYLDGYRVATEESAEAFLFIAIEKAPPYAVAVYHANEDMIDQGRSEYQRDLITYAECLAKDEWPGYPEEIASLVLPRWTQEVM